LIIISFLDSIRKGIFSRPPFNYLSSQIDIGPLVTCLHYIRPKINSILYLIELFLPKIKENNLFLIIVNLYNMSDEEKEREKIIEKKIKEF